MPRRQPGRSRTPAPKHAIRSTRRVPRPTAASGSVEIVRQGGGAIAVLTRPAMANRVSATMASNLMELAETVEDDDSLQVLVLTGAGECFCSGFDEDVNERLVETLSAISKPTVAILNGDALDEGLELALALDIRVAVRGARCALTQLQRDRLPRFGGTQRLPRLIGATRALLMILTGESLSAVEAQRLGLVTWLGRDRRELNSIKGELLATLESKGPLALRLAKDAVRKGYDMTLEQGIRLEEDLYALLQTTSDRAEGVRAFLEKRKPIFKGA